MPDYCSSAASFKPAVVLTSKFSISADTSANEASFTERLAVRTNAKGPLRESFLPTARHRRLMRFLSCALCVVFLDTTQANRGLLSEDLETVRTKNLPCSFLSGRRAEKSARVSRRVLGILDRKASAALEATAAQHIATVGRARSFQKPVRAASLSLFWLIRSFRCHSYHYTYIYEKGNSTQLRFRYPQFIHRLFTTRRTPLQAISS